MKESDTKPDPDADKMRDEYDFSGAVRGKYLQRYRHSSNVIVLDADVAARFKNARAVNEALRAMVRIAEKSS